jgi:flagellar motor switch protein FliN
MNEPIVEDKQATDGLMALLHADQPQEAQASPADLARILKLSVPIIVKLADRKLSLAEVMRLDVGAIIEFSKSSEEPLELMINNKVIGAGEAVKVRENFGLRITTVGDVRHLIQSMAGAA